MTVKFFYTRAATYADAHQFGAKSIKKLFCAAASSVAAFLFLLLFLPIEANAHHCKGKHANDPECDAPPPPPPPNPEVCTDEFPSFVYTKPGKRGPDELRVSSSEGCRTEFLANVIASRGPAFSYDNNRGLVAWTEDAENYDITILRFSYDQDEDLLTVDSPQTVLATQRPSDTEYFFAIDTWVNYNAMPEVELIAFERLTVSGQRGSIEVLDLATCSEGCSPVEILALSALEQQSCIANADPTDFPVFPDDFPHCFKPNSGVFFNPAGNALYYLGQAEQWQAIMRVGLTNISESGGTPELPKFVVVHDVYDCETGALSHGGHSIGLVSEQEVIAASACVGFQTKGRGLRDQRLYFLDVDDCMSDPLNWQSCQAMGLRSGEYNGVNPSWLSNGEILYGGFTKSTLDSLRIFDPNLSYPGSDREVIERAVSADTGL